MFPFFNNYPGTDLHEIDLAYILKLCAELRASNTTLTEWKARHETEYDVLNEKVEGLINNLVDIISPWDSSVAYHIYSIVEYQGTNYIAIQDVPVGTMITNTEYWQPANTALEQINAIGVSVSELINERAYVTPEMYGAIGDGVTDDFDAIQAAFDSGIGDVIFGQGKTYLVKLENFTNSGRTRNYIGLQLHSGTTIHGNGATIKVDNSTIDEPYTLLCTKDYDGPAYFSDIAGVHDITINDLILDGNELNLSQTNSLTGLAIYNGSNINIENITVNNMFGTDGEGYGIIFAYSDNIILNNAIIPRASRSGLYCWESELVTVLNSNFSGGLFRDCVTCSANDPIAVQASSIVFDNCSMNHQYTSGTHAARFTGHVTGALRNCKIAGNSAIDVISIPVGGAMEVELSIENCTITGGTIGINQNGTPTKPVKLDIINSVIESAKAIVTGGADVMLKGSVLSNTDSAQNMNITGNNIHIADNDFSGCSYMYLEGALLYFNNNKLHDIVGQQNAYQVSIQKHAGAGYAIATNNYSDEPTKYIRIYCTGKAINNHLLIMGETASATNVDTTGSNG